MKLNIVLILIAASFNLNAAPLRYNLTGDFLVWDRYAGIVEQDTFTGSMILSDPTFIDFYSTDPYDSRGQYVNRMTVSDFSISSSSHSLTQAGDSYLSVAFAGGAAWSINTIFSISSVDEFGVYRLMDGSYLALDWFGPIDEQPISLEIPALYFFGTDDTYRLLNITATAVPLPAAIWLFGSGIIGLIGFGSHWRGSWGQVFRLARKR